MTTLATGASASLSVRDGGSVAIATNGGMGSVVVTPTAGTASTVTIGPDAQRRIFGPYSEGAAFTITNQSCGAFDYEAEGFGAFDPASVAITGGTIADGVTINTGLTPTVLIKALAKVRAGTADCRILLVGDSTTWGTGATPGVISPAPLIAARLAAQTGLPVYSNFVCPASPSASVQDSRVTLGSGWALGGNYGFGSNASWQASNGAAGNLTVTYSGFADKVRIYYLQNSGLGTFTPTVNTVAKTAQSAVGAAVIGVYEATFTRSNANTLVLAPSVNTLFILGIEWFDTTQKCVYIGGAGVPSSTSGDWAQSASWKALPMIAAYAPDHCQINLGINDAATSIAAGAYQTNMAAIATQAAATGGVDLQTFYSADTALNRLTLETAYLAALRSLVASAGYGLVDTRAALGEYATANGFGFMSDAVHPNALGYAVSSRWQTRRLAQAAN